MFKETDKNPQYDMFSSMSCILVGEALKEYSDENGWHNRFREQVVSRIDESSYNVLFSKDMGAPNASISLLVGMMILKEAFGWSDAQLYENCRFNLLVRCALGLLNLSDVVPAPSTYYLLRSRMYNHFKLNGTNLLEKTFETVTKGQVNAFKVNAESIRMDSKLISSNIAFYSRYEIIHRTLSLFAKSIDQKRLYKLSKEEKSLLDEVLKEEPLKTVYHSTKDQICHKLQPIGLLMLRMLKVFKGSSSKTDEYRLLNRVFSDQYEKTGQHEVELRANESIASGSVQSPHDPDASYRNKGSQKVKGYSVNVTETVSESGYLDLITDVDVRQANTPDTAFVKDAVKATTKVTDQTVSKVYADGAYQSPDNDMKDVDMVYTGIQGSQPRFIPEETPDGLVVTDTETGGRILATPVKKQNKQKRETGKSKGKSWHFTTGEGKKIYISESAVRTSEKRKEMKQRPIEELRKRNNVEATIFQLSYPLRNAKTKYRGLFKQKLWAICRCMWINEVRIVNFMEQVSQRALQTV